MVSQLGPRAYIPGIAPEGYPFIAAGAVASVALALCSRRAALCSLLYTTGAALFFRDPARPLPTDPRHLVAAADGLITRVETIDEPRYVGGRALRIVTCLSLLDVPINRMPVAGTVEYLEHLQGQFRAAWDAQAHEVNERNYIGIATEHGPVLMVQIAGLVARRIVCHARTGGTYVAGSRIGMIRFGSRTDVIVPSEAALALVVPGMRVAAGVTPIGEWR
jgi:phosphatidylserine decarboxylase